MSTENCRLPSECGSAAPGSFIPACKFGEIYSTDVLHAYKSRLLQLRALAPMLRPAALKQARALNMRLLAAGSLAESIAFDKWGWPCPTEPEPFDPDPAI